MKPSKTPTFYIVTVHYKEKKWIQIQDRYIQKHTDFPYKVIAVTSKGLEDYTPQHWMTIRDSGVEDHARKLNIAGDFASQIASESDIIVFLDSDCFPVANWCSEIIKLLNKKKFAAVQRLENMGDMQPHPCFACIEPKLWKQIKGDWGGGYRWINSNGNLVTDVGGNMLLLLRQNKIDWLPIHRTNSFNPHPVLFGIYGGIFYHHGAGSRQAHTRVDTIRGRTRFVYFKKILLELKIYFDNSFASLKKYILKETSLVDVDLSINNRQKGVSLSHYYAKKIADDEDIVAIFQPQEMTRSASQDSIRF